MHAVVYPTIFALLATVIRAQNTPQAQNLYQGTTDASVHADLPFLSESKKKRWYIYLVIAIVGLAFLCSISVVIMGILKWQRRKRLLEKKADETGDIEDPRKVLYKGMDVQEAVNLKQNGMPAKLDLLPYKPSQAEEVRLRDLQKGREEAFMLERKRRTAQHEKPLQTLHHLRRLNSS